MVGSEHHALTILIVDDDPTITGTLRRYFDHSGYRCLCAADGLTALKMARAHAPDLVVLDRMLPGLEGGSVCRLLREESAVPIIMLTARATESERLEGLNLGADDYVVKPFSPRELVARARAVLRRTAPTPPAGFQHLEIGALVISMPERVVRVGNVTLALTPSEFNLIAFLAGAPGRVFARATLLEQLFGWDCASTLRTVDSHIKNLRRKLRQAGVDPSPIETVFGVGYRLGKPRRD
jgi:DNA-binding response OmpR family regulator